MKNVFILLALLFIGINQSSGQDYMDKILEKSCECAEKVPDTLNINQFNTALGFCIIDAAMPYKKQLKKDFGIDLDNIDVEGEKLGKTIGLKMVSYCPATLQKITSKASASKTESPEDTELKITGQIAKIEFDHFVIFSVRDENGKITKYYWLTFIDSNIELTSNYMDMVGRPLEITYRTEDFFDPKIEQYRQFFIITKLNIYNN